MRVICRKNAVKFNELKPGDLFLWGGEVYMKVTIPLASTSETAVFLETGELMSFNPTEYFETVQNMVLAPVELVSES